MDCGFFSAHVYAAIRNGPLAASEGVFSASCLQDYFLVLSFLGSRLGTDIPPFLPADGWDVLVDAHCFVASIQWFLTGLSGLHIGM